MDNITLTEETKPVDIETIEPIKTDEPVEPIETEEEIKTYKKGDIIKSTGVGIILTITGFIGGQLQATPSEKITVEDAEKPREELSVKIETPTVISETYTLSQLDTQYKRIEDIIAQYNNSKETLLKSEGNEDQIARIDDIISSYQNTLKLIQDKFTRVDGILN